MKVVPNGPQASSEHEFEAQPGLPERLPGGERLLWQGSPDWRVLARRVLHTRTLSIYFGLMLIWRGAMVAEQGGSAFDAALAVLWLLPLALMAIGVLTSVAWLMARTSVYTITDKRVVMRIGVVLNVTFNLPYARIESAGLRANADGSGDLALLLAEPDRIGFGHLWPHARPWQVKRPQPMLRAVAGVDAVAAVLTAAMAAAAANDAAATSGSGVKSDDGPGLSAPQRLHELQRQPLAA